MENSIKRAIMAINQTMNFRGLSDVEKDVLQGVHLERQANDFHNLKSVELHTSLVDWFDRDTKYVCQSCPHSLEFDWHTISSRNQTIPNNNTLSSNSSDQTNLDLQIVSPTNEGTTSTYNSKQNNLIQSKTNNLSNICKELFCFPCLSRSGKVNSINNGKVWVRMRMDKDIDWHLFKHTLNHTLEMVHFGLDIQVCKHYHLEGVGVGVGVGVG
ncbi:hypothetical protein I4U23_022240 [Adineta vaga]|nr:hypothetical protein I4U23_022240 [Adineta vaga]